MEDKRVGGCLVKWPTQYTVHSTQYTVHSTQYKVHSTLLHTSLCAALFLIYGTDTFHVLKVDANLFGIFNLLGQCRPVGQLAIQSLPTSAP